MGVGPGRDNLTSLIALGLNATFGLDQWEITGASKNVVSFKLGLSVFNLNLQSSLVGPVNVAPMSGLLDWLLTDVIVPAFNEDFQGIPITQIGEIGLQDIEV